MMEIIIHRDRAFELNDWYNEGRPSLCFEDELAKQCLANWGNRVYQIDQESSKFRAKKAEPEVTFKP